MNNDEIIRDIKRDLHAQMNGMASAAMREAGLTADYRVNFGVELPRLQEMAVEVADICTETGAVDADMASLAQQLWKEAVRECRILALWIMPPFRMNCDLAEVWAEQIHTVELAQLAAMQLFSKVAGISSLAFQWIACEAILPQILGFYTLLHLIRKGQLSERSRQELRDQAEAAAEAEDYELKKVANNVLQQL